MYLPEHFSEQRRDVLTTTMRDIQFSALITPTADNIEVTHVPVVVHHDIETDQITLETHVARPNPHWRAVTEPQPSVAIFQGPHSYVTPEWYPSKKEHGKVVPTWAYITVHAHGQLTAIQDDEWLANHLNELTRQNEANRDVPWEVTDAPEKFIGALSRGIVGLRLTVDRLEGKWKVNQNRPEADRKGTADGLAKSGPMGVQLAKVLQ